MGSKQQRPGWTRRLVLVSWAAASATLMVVGAFAPWLTLFGNPVRGTDFENGFWIVVNDGWMVVTLAVLAVAAFLLMRQSQLAAIPAIGGGALAAYTTIEQRRFLNLIEDGEFFLIGWGLNLAILASISLALCGLVWVMTFSHRAEEPLPAVEPVEGTASPEQI